MIAILKEMSERTKRQLLLELRGEPKSVNELVASTGMKQPNVSNHLAKFKSKGMVKATKIGRQVFYSLADPTIEAAISQLLSQETHQDSIVLNLDEMSKQYARLAVAGDEPACAKIVDYLIQQRVSLIRIYQQVLAESMEYVGKWYAVEAIDIGQEHLASAITERMMSRVVHYAPPIRTTAQVVVLGCVPGNWHSIGLRMISDFMRLNGWKSVYLGANVPEVSFHSSIKDHNPDLVLMTCGVEEQREATITLIQHIRERSLENKPLLIGIGGKQASIRSEEFIAAGVDFIAPSLMVYAEEIFPRIESGTAKSLGVFTNHKKLD